MSDSRRERIDDDDTDDEEEQRREESTFWGRMRSWVFCIFWIIGGYFTMKHTDLVGVLLHSNLVYRFVLNISLLLLGLTVAVACYLTLFIEVQNYEVAILHFLPQKPRAIPVATFTWVSGSTFFAIAIWPVYHLLTFPIMFVLFVGFVNLISLIPSGKYVSLFFCI